MPYKPREIEKVLQKKFGFSPAQGHSSDHRWYELQLAGLQPILTKVSHTKKEIGRKLEGIIARQLHVRGNYFKGMMDCQNSKEDYYQKIRNNPYPPF